MKIGICVGNGLTIDLQNSYKDELKKFDTYSFFSWDVKTPGNKTNFIDSLPRLKNALEKIPSKDNDFKIVEEIIENYSADPSDFEKAILLTELQHYICLAFSTYQKSVDKINLEDWKWVKWLQQIDGELLFDIV